MSLVPTINDPTSETSSVLDLFQHVFIPTYTYDQSLGEMAVSINISNVNTLYVSQLQYDGVGVGDANGNFSIGTSNSPSFTNFSNTLEVGFKTGQGLGSGSNVIAFGNYALENGSGGSSSRTVVLGHFAAQHASNTCNAVIIGHEAGNRAANITRSILIGQDAGYLLAGSNQVLGSVVLGDAAYSSGNLVRSVIIGASAQPFNSGSNVFVLGSNNLITGRFDTGAVAIRKAVDDPTAALDVNGNAVFQQDVHIKGNLTVDGSGLNIDTSNGKLILLGDTTSIETLEIRDGGQAIGNGYLGVNISATLLNTSSARFTVSGNSEFWGPVTVSGGPLQVGSSANICGATWLGGTFNASGISTFGAGVNICTGIAVAGTFNATGISTFTSNVNICGATWVGGTFNTSGISTFGSGVNICAGLAVGSNTTISGALNVYNGAIAYHQSPSYPNVTEGAQLLWNTVGTVANGQAEYVNARGLGAGGFSFYDGADGANVANLSLCMTTNPTRTYIPKNLNISGNVTVEQSVSLSGDLTVAGTTRLQDEIVYGSLQLVNPIQVSPPGNSQSPFYNFSATLSAALTFPNSWTQLTGWDINAPPYAFSYAGAFFSNTTGIYRAPYNGLYSFNVIWRATDGGAVSGFRLVYNLTSNLQDYWNVRANSGDVQSSGIATYSLAMNSNDTVYAAVYGGGTQFINWFGKLDIRL